MSDLIQRPDTRSSWELIPLTPEYLDSEHGAYVRAIEDALMNKTVLNIALSGNYGVGKSSILREAARRLDGRAIELSLSTLGPNRQDSPDQSVPNQAMTQTNLIQKEIVKQLLYRQESRRMPGSRFNRIERLSLGRELAVSVILGLIISLVFLITGWSSQIELVFSSSVQLGLWVHLLVWVLSSIVVLALRYLLYGKVNIRQLSAGSATVTLDEQSVSYFDQYLDEIVYFFDVSDHDVVIFEDIDRFHNSHIFETLRSLNTLLNSSPQIKKPVRFIYAIRDSIFDKAHLETEGRNTDPHKMLLEDPSEAEALLANRTKFFDLVIPVVPFITHQNARNLASKTLSNIRHEVKPELLDLAVRYIPEMRLLKNVRNEFLVFRDHILSREGELLGLSETDLFAMMLYKSTHLKDFEAIRIGKSNLDTLYIVSRKLVSDNILRIEQEQRALRQRLARLDGADTRSEELGDRLIAHIDRTAESTGSPRQHGTYLFANQTRSKEDLKSAQFWREFVSADGNPVLQWRINGYSQTLSFSRSNLVQDLGDPLDAEEWEESERNTLTKELDKCKESLRFLRGADLSDLIHHPEYLVDYEGGEQPLEAVALSLLSPGLAFQLVQSNYIKRYFTLYTATFHSDRVSPTATSFIIHHFERDLMDEQFNLSDADVDSIVEEVGEKSLKEPALYNIAILDRLLHGNKKSADIMINSLAELGERQKRFIQSYLSSGIERSKFMEHFTKASPRALDYIITQVELDDSEKLDLINTALAHLEVGMKYDTNGTVSSYLLDGYGKFSTLTSATTTPRQADSIAALFDHAGIILPSLGPLDARIRSSFVHRNLYEITAENLKLVLGQPESISLDGIKTKDQIAYDYVLNNLDEYLVAIAEVAPTVDSTEAFIPVVEDVLERESEQISDVVKFASPECIVDELTKAPEMIWPILARFRRFTPTFSNFQSYFIAIGEIDDNLATLLTVSNSIVEAHKADNEEKTILAIAILAARDTIQSEEHRVRLIGSLNLDSKLSVNDIEAEEGDLFPLLISHGIIEDNVSVYEHLEGASWATREALISVSQNFKDYVTPIHLHGDLAKLLESDLIGEATKKSIVERGDAFADTASQDDLIVLAQYATRHSIQIPKNVVVRMAQSGVPATFVIPLINPHLVDIDLQELFSILSSLEGDYPSLTSVGKDQPKIPKSSSNLALLERLKLGGIVSKFDSDLSTIRVYKRHK